MIYRYVVSRDDTRHMTWPDLALTPSGRLVCVFTMEDRDEETRAKTTQVMITISDDRGHTWSEPRAVTQSLTARSQWERSWGCPRLTSLSDGRLVVIVDCRQSLGSAGSFTGKDENWICFSPDNGETWQEPYKTSVDGVQPDRIVEVKSGAHAGRWLTVSHVLQGGNRQRRRIQCSWISENRGVSWIGPFAMVDDPNLNLSEGCLLVLPDGEIVCFLHDESGNSQKGLYRTVSRNGGMGWGDVASFPLLGCRHPSLGILRSGRVLITFAAYQGVPMQPGKAENFFATLTDVDSCTTTPDNIKLRSMPLDYDRSTTPGFGHSGWVQFPDGGIYVVNHVMDNAPKSHIRGYYMWESDFVLPVPVSAAQGTSGGSNGSSTPFSNGSRSKIVPPRSITAPPFPMRVPSAAPFSGR